MGEILVEVQTGNSSWVLVKIKRCFVVPWKLLKVLFQSHADHSSIPTQPKVIFQRVRFSCIVHTHTYLYLRRDITSALYFRAKNNNPMRRWTFSFRRRDLFADGFAVQNRFIYPFCPNRTSPYVKGFGFFPPTVTLSGFPRHMLLLIGQRTDVRRLVYPGKTRCGKMFHSFMAFTLNTVSRFYK